MCCEDKLYSKYMFFKKKNIFNVWMTLYQTNGNIISWKIALNPIINLPGQIVRNN